MARASASCPVSARRETTWPGWTLAPSPTASSARRSKIGGSIRSRTLRRPRRLPLAQTLGDREEAGSELAPDPVPAADQDVALGFERAVVELDAGSLGEIDPVLEDLARHLGMELHAPDAVADAEGLQAD